MTEYLELHIIELPKIHKLKEKEKNNELIKWMYFLENPESKKVDEYMKENKGIKEAKEKLETMSEDERMQILADLRLKAIMDEKAAKRLAYEEGIESGVKDGIKQGKTQQKLEIAKRMKEKGIDIEYIKDITGLTEEEIKKL